MNHTAGNTALRLIWPQWQGAAHHMVQSLFPEVPLPEARRGYAVGARVLEAILPPHDGPSAIVNTDLTDAGTEEKDGVEAKEVITAQLEAALTTIAAHAPSSILTLGGECSVSVAPFSYLASLYGEDLAVIWIDSHPDVGTPASEYNGYHAMAVAALTGHGDFDVQALLPSTVPGRHVALAGLHSWTEDDFPNVAAWGLTTFSPSDLRADSRGLIEWLRETGCSRVAIHFDVDAIDSDEAVFGLGAEIGGLTSAEVRRLTADIGAVSDVVGLTVAEFIPRQVIQISAVLDGMPLIGTRDLSAARRAH